MNSEKEYERMLAAIENEFPEIAAAAERGRKIKEQIEEFKSQVTQLRAELASAKAASVVPVEVLSHIRLGLGRVVIEFQSELEAESFVIWLRDRMQERGNDGH